jgi:hypothetical protein
MMKICLKEAFAGYPFRRRLFVFGFFSLIVAVGIFFYLRPALRWEIQSPYNDVDWKTHRQYKANFHAHTTLSDGKMTPQETVDLYFQSGYKILALTDHDTIGPTAPTWPWQSFDRDPDALGMIAIVGNEISKHHHIGSYFCDYGDSDADSEESILEGIGRRQGLAIFCHPGKYKKSAAWYAEKFLAYPHVIGIEIYNRGDRFLEDRKKWDAVLTDIMPERFVWGFSSDDMHDPKDGFGHNWNMVLLPELSTDQVREAMKHGRFFFVYAPKGLNGPPPPEIKLITINSPKGTIHIEAAGYEKIEWISEGKVFYRGARVRLSRFPDIGGYVRAMIYTVDHGPVIGTQPFRIKRFKGKP